MAQHPASSRRGDDRLATRVSQSPPGGLVCGGIAILAMVLALAGVLPRPMFLVGAAALVVVAYTLDKRFKTKAPPDAASTPTPTPASAPPPTPTPAPAPTPAPTPAGAEPPVLPSGPPPSLLPITDLQAEHARLTRELSDRVDDDEDVRFEKFMRLRRIDDEIQRQQGAAPT
jgi:hypothetical protein